MNQLKISTRLWSRQRDSVQLLLERLICHIQAQLGEYLHLSFCTQVPLRSKQRCSIDHRRTSREHSY